MLYISSRYDGIVYQVTPNGNMSVYVEGMGVATGLAFDAEDNLYVGDRSGTIFKIARNRQIFVFATLEPSIAAYHLAFGPDGYLYVTGPTTSSFDSVYRISPTGEVEVFYRGLGRPQGHGVRRGGPALRGGVAGRAQGRGAHRRRTARPSCSSPAPASWGWRSRRRARMIVATTNALYRVDVGIKGRPLRLKLNAEIIAVGSETADAAAARHQFPLPHRQLNALGVEVATKAVVGDDRERLAEAVRRAVARSEIVILSGGLGPTEDDVTRDAVALALDRRLIFDARDRRSARSSASRARGRKMAEVNQRQAFVIEGAEVLPNDRGTAPGPVDRGIRRRHHAAARPAARTEGHVHAPVPAAAGAAACRNR